ncbi:gluconate 5-dehydrogenase [Yersinia enterocolitica]|nr:gluconate 5-dehydrogenase [Yersinia enterocolitica]
MDVLTASLRSACFHRCGHFVNNLRATSVTLSLFTCCMIFVS